MIDTIVLRLHGANQQVKTNLEKIKSENTNTTIQKVPEHFDLYSKLLQFKGKSFSLVKTYNKELYSNTTLKDDEFLSTQTSSVVNNYYLSLNKQQFIYADKVKEHNLKVRGKYSLTSQSHDVVFNININAGYIEFNFSIPKYLYGHQLLQFVPQIFSNSFRKDSFKYHSFDFQSKKLYQRLIKFIDYFFTDLCKKFKVDTLPNYNYIEIFRIDFCYNQYFENKDQALMYLNEQKKIHKKRSHKKSKVLTEDITTKNYETSLTIGRSSGNYFKIYHKGSEYISPNGDYHKHKKINEHIWDQLAKRSTIDHSEKHIEFCKNYFDVKVKKDPKDPTFKQYFSTTDLNLKKERQKVSDLMYKNMYIKVPFLKNEADRILRYEMSVSGQYLSNIYKKYIFRKDCSIHRQYNLIYKNVKKLENRKHSYKYQISEHDQKIYKSFHKFYNRKIGLLLQVPTSINRYINFGKYSVSEYSKNYVFKKPYGVYNKGTLLETKDIGLFQTDLLLILCKEFKKTIDLFQIKKMIPYDTFITKIKLHNKLIKDKVSQYNEINKYKVKNIDGSFKIKGNRIITKAFQLLTEKEKFDKKLKKVNPIMIMEFYRLMVDDKLTISQIQQKLNLDKHAFLRRKKLLNYFNVFENSMNLEIPINPTTDFKEYYFKSEILDYFNKIFIKSSHAYIDHYFINDNQFTNTLNHEFRNI